MRFEVDRRRVVHETIEGESIVINMDTGVYYSLEGTGSQIWRALAAGCAPDTIAGWLRNRYEGIPERIEAAVSTLVEELRREGLLQEAHESPPDEEPWARVLGNGDAVSRHGEFEAPILHRYSDMTDFMVIDPIHEVDQRGWPNRHVTS
jgi:hypothetical protein